MVDDGFHEGQETAVLLSGGLDSAVLVAHEARRGWVHPVYVATGLSWERHELDVVTSLLASGALGTRLRPLARLGVDMRDVYPPSHWAVKGEPPGYETPDEDVYIEGRNLVLLSKAGVYCARQGIGRIALGPLAGNPFPDATPAFFEAMGRALSLGLDRPMTVAAPFAGLRKAAVIRLGLSLGVPVELTLSCMNPRGLRHCGCCSKCRERQQAFAEAGVEDRSVYAA